MYLLGKHASFYKSAAMILGKHASFCRAAAMSLPQTANVQLRRDIRAKEAVATSGKRPFKPCFVLAFKRMREAIPRGGLSFHTISNGQKFTLEHTFHKDDVEAYSKLCGDSNPVHSVDTAARSVGFEGCVVHGMLHAALLPALISFHFPGARLDSKTMTFRAPVLVGESLQAQAEVLKVHDESSFLRVEFATTCYKKKDNLLVLDGKATAIVPICTPSWLL